MKQLILLALCVAGLSFGQSNDPCSGHQAIAVTTSGATTIVAGVSNTNIHLCDADLSLATAADVKFVSVGSGAKDLTGLYANRTAICHDFHGQPVGLGMGFGISLSASVVGGGTVNYYLTYGH